MDLIPFCVIDPTARMKQILLVLPGAIWPSLWGLLSSICNS